MENFGDIYMKAASPPMYDKSRAAAARVARKLDKAKVPYVLFGRMAFALVGSEVRDFDIEFVIPDAQWQAAVDTLVKKKKYTVCTTEDCRHFFEDRFDALDFDPAQEPEEKQVKLSLQVWFSKQRYHPIPPVHFHITDPVIFTIKLYRQSHLLWWLPPIQRGPPTPNDPYYVLSTDAARLPAKGRSAWEAPLGFQRLNLYGLASGPWSKLHPIKVLTAKAQVEACMLLLCRDLHVRRRLDWRWFCSLYCLGERRVPGQTRLQARAAYNLREDFQPFWDYFRGHTQVARTFDIFDSLLQLRLRLIAMGELPDLPTPDPAPLRFMLTQDCGSHEEYQRAKMLNSRPWMGWKLFKGSVDGPRGAATNLEEVAAPADSPDTMDYGTGSGPALTMP